MKKTKLVPGVAIALTVLCGSAALAQSPEEKQRGRGPEQGPPWAAARFLFQRFDEDRNRSLEEEEVPGPVWDRLSEADANEDGSVTQREVIQLATSRLFGRFDENEDDKLSEPEVPGLMWKRLSKADSDEDGLISFGELVDNILSAPRGGRPVDRDKPKNRGIRGGK